MRFLTAGESHGKALIGIIEGLPSGLAINTKHIDDMLSRRQDAVGRGERQRLFRDKAEILSGLNEGVTTGAPLCLMIRNGGAEADRFDFFRPGHVDRAASLKYGYDPYVGAERGSARETAMRTAVGAVCYELLRVLGIEVCSKVISVGGKAELSPRDVGELEACGDTVGGKLKVIVRGLKAGIGSHVFYDRRVDYRLGGAFMSIPAVKAVECGLGTGYAGLRGSEAADRIKDGKRVSNYCGGTEGGITDGEDLDFTLTIKPVPSVAGLETTDKNNEPCLTRKVRGDVTAVYAACVVAEAVASFEIADLILECLGGDTVAQIRKRYSELHEKE